MNGAWISGTSQKHTTADTSSTQSEAVEMDKDKCAKDLVFFRSALAELGLWQENPSKLNEATATVSATALLEGRPDAV